MRYLSNGDIEFAKTEPFPKREPKGYVRDENNSLLFHPDFEPCRFRNLQLAETRCGKMRNIWWCSKFLKGVNTDFCGMCQVPLEQR